MSEYICICDTCRIPIDCWPRSGIYAMSADQDFTELCARYRKRVETNFERLFGTPERAAQTIIDGCGGDCYVCIMPDDAPCFMDFGSDEVGEDAMVSWLESEAE